MDCEVEAWQCLHPSCKAGYSSPLNNGVPLHTTYRECSSCFPFVSGQSVELLKVSSMAQLNKIEQLLRDSQVVIHDPPNIVIEDPTITLPFEPNPAGAQTGGSAANKPANLRTMPFSSTMSIQLPPAIFSSTLYIEGQKLVYTKQFPSDLIQIFTPPSNDINIDQYRKEYVVHKKSLQLSQLGKSIDHVVHEHQLDDEIVDSVVHPSACSLCSTGISSGEKVFFCSTCQYAECKVCYPNHSGRDQQLSASIDGDNATLSQSSDESVGITAPTDDAATNATNLIKSGSLETNNKDDDNDDDDDVPENIPIDDLPDLVFVGTDGTNPHLHQIGSLYRHQFHRHQLQYLTSMKDGIDYMCAECQTKGSGYGQCYKQHQHPIVGNASQHHFLTLIQSVALLHDFCHFSLRLSFPSMFLLLSSGLSFTVWL